MPCPCPVCGSQTEQLDPVDLNKCCRKDVQHLFPQTGIQVIYEMCPHCGYAFAPQFLEWSEEDFLTKIYNDAYVTLDPDYEELRPKDSLDHLQTLFSRGRGVARHLDYGGGNGRLSALMKENGWRSTSFDPFPENKTTIEALGSFDFITAFEVFEHVPDVHVLMKNICSLLEKPGLVFFTTVVSDGHIALGRDLSWWYASPRNGHVSLFSYKSLALLAERYGLRYSPQTHLTHAFLRDVPAWVS